MAITDQNAVEHIQEVSTDREPILVEAPQEKPAEPKPTEQPDYTKTIDRMGNELGELRKQNAELMAQLTNMQAPNVEAEKVSFESDPEGFIKQAVADALGQTVAPQLQVLESDLLGRKAEKFDEKLSTVYPDWKETAEQPDFAEWIKASPARAQMFQIADQNFDVDSAAELIKRYKQDQAERKAGEQGALAAAGIVESGGDSGGATVYAASEIMRMKQNDPAEYNRWLAGDGMKAYQEGRVDQNR